MKRYITFTLLLFIASSVLHAGYVNMSFTDFARNRIVECIVYYPGSDSAEGQPFYRHYGQCNVAAFSGGRNMHWTYYNSLHEYPNYTQVLVIPKSYMDSTESDSAVALDMLACLRFMQQQNSDVTSLFFNNLTSAYYLAGHSRGGSIAVLAAAYTMSTPSPPIAGVFVITPAASNPSAISAARNVKQRALIVAGSNDCLAPVASNARRLYDSLASVCKTMVTVRGANHCQFLDSCAACLQREGPCGTSTNRTSVKYLLGDYQQMFTAPDARYVLRSTYTSAVTLLTTSRFGDTHFIRSTKSRACVGDTVLFSTDSLLSSYLWLPDSVRTSTYTVVVRKSMDVRLRIPDACFPWDVYSSLSTEPQQLQLSQSTVTICDGGSTTVAVTNAQVYSSLRSSDGQRGPVFTLSKGGYYTIRAYDPEVCAEAVDSVRVLIAQPQRFKLEPERINSPCDSQVVHRVSFPKGSFVGKYLLNWSTGDSATSLTLQRDGVYSVWVKGLDTATMCRVYSDTVLVTVHTIKHPKPTIEQQGTLLVSSPATYYNWKKQGQLIDGAVSRSYQPLSSGRYSVYAIYDSIFQCSNESDEFNYELNDIAVSHDIPDVSIRDRHISIRAITATPCILYNALGQICAMANVTNGESDLDCTALSSGLYLLEFKQSRRFLTLVLY